MGGMTPGYYNALWRETLASPDRDGLLERHPHSEI
jgi:hypothetical protein